MGDAPRAWVGRAVRSRAVFALGSVALFLAGERAARAAEHLRGDPHRPELHAASTLPLEPVAVEPSWVREGQPRVLARVFGQPGGVQVGVWEAQGPTRLELQFGLDETVYGLEGHVEIESGGRTYRVGPGDSAFFPAGSRATWHIPERFKKVFTLEEPGRLARWLRKLQ